MKYRWLWRGLIAFVLCVWIYSKWQSATTIAGLIGFFLMISLISELLGSYIFDLPLIIYFVIIYICISITAIVDLFYSFRYLWRPKENRVVLVLNGFNILLFLIIYYPVSVALKLS